MKVLLLLILFAACAHEKPSEHPEAAEAPPKVAANPSPDAGSSMESKQVAAESNAPFVTEILFKKGASTLSKEARSRLRKLLKDVSDVSRVDEVDAFAWSDHEYPGDQTAALPPAEHDLAKARGDAIVRFIETSEPKLKGKVKVITMTERPSGLNKALSMGDTREKKLFQEAGINTTDKNKHATPKASHASVMILLKS